jgi:hypothetical protein
MTDSTIHSVDRSYPMLMTKERKLAVRTLRGWAISILREAGAIHECEYHAWAKERADPHARERALDLARQEPPLGISPQAACVAVAEVLDSIGDTCPECPPQ